MGACPACGTKAEEEQKFCTDCGTGLTAADHAGDDEEIPAYALDRVGKVLGSYRVTEILGIGGMGTVFAAEHTRLGRRVAIKMLHPECTGEVVKRFFAESFATITLVGLGYASKIAMG